MLLNDKIIEAVNETKKGHPLKDFLDDSEIIEALELLVLLITLLKQLGDTNDN